uniref:Uncharacterized protein n=1 Tax=Terrapene triunguis TaxID=2587831 RepID=A0A674JPW7_9SAUR
MGKLPARHAGSRAHRAAAGAAARTPDWQGSGSWRRKDHNQVSAGTNRSPPAPTTAPRHSPRRGNAPAASTPSPVPGAGRCRSPPPSGAGPGAARCRDGPR